MRRVRARHLGQFCKSLHGEFTVENSLIEACLRGNKAHAANADFKLRGIALPRFGSLSRRSIRGFKSTPVPEETLKKILQAANQSPSYTNTQPWEVAVVNGAKRDALSKILHDMASSGAPSRSEVPAPAKWPAELADRASVHNARRFRLLEVERDDANARNELRMMNYKFFDAPCVLFLFMDSTLSQWSTFDMGLFTQTLTLAAHDLGLGTCLQASLTHYPDAVRDFLCLPQNKKLMLGISLGYPDRAAKLNSYQSSRKSLDAFVTWYR